MFFDFLDGNSSTVSKIALFREQTSQQVVTIYIYNLKKTRRR
jgi:hypothetical protein